MLTRAIGAAAQFIIQAIVHALSMTRIHPNFFTAFGLVINIYGAYLFGSGQFFQAGLVVVGAGLFDMLDGRIARVTNTTSVFGGFFDSVIDRYSDLALYIGLLVYYSRVDRFFYVVLVAIVMTGTVMVSYVRARAENVIPSCKVGFMERPERIVLLIIGALWDRMAPVLFILALISNLTVIHRIIHTWEATQNLPVKNNAAS